MSKSRGEKVDVRPLTWRDYLFAVVAIILIGFLLILLAKIVTNDTDLSLVRTDNESAAIIRANERVAQLTQWTISTILIVAGGLIGLNWYRDEKRYEREQSAIADRFTELHRQMGIHSDLIAGNQRQLANISRESADGLFYQTLREIQQTIDLFEIYDIIKDARERLLTIESAPQKRCKGLIQEGVPWMTNMILTEVAVNDQEDWDEFMNFWDERCIEYPDLAEQINELKSYVEVLLSMPEEDVDSHGLEPDENG